MQMKEVGQVLTRFWIREGPEAMLGKQEFTAHIKALTAVCIQVLGQVSFLT